MKVSLVSLLVLLYISHNLAEENLESTESNSSPRKPPPYLKAGDKLYYYYNKSAIPTSMLGIIFRQLERSTCLKFQLKKDGPISHKIGINFNISEKEDTVELSTSENSPTNVSLTNDTYTDDTLLRFYIGIALDIIPEVRRPDRDIDVNVNMSNVEEKFVQYYNITNSSYITYLNDTEFDFRSPMFFGPDFGSKVNKSTYEVLLYKGDQYPSGRGRSFRHNFYKYIFYYYCNGSEKQNNCKYGGYPNPHDNNNKCKCPEHLSGDFCTKFNNDSTIFSNYTIPSPLEANLTKQYYSVNLTNTIFYLNITSERENTSVTVENITFSKTNCSNAGSFLEVLVRKDKGAAGMYLCRNSTNFTLPSLSNEVFFALNAKNGNESIFLNVSYITVKKKEEEENSEDTEN